MRRVTGIDLLGDLSTFFGLLGDMTDDFSTRAVAVEQMLRDPTTAFLLVTSAATAAVDEAIWFRQTLEEGGLPFAGTIVNRVHHDRLGDAEPADVAAELAAELPEALAGRVAATFDDYHRLARRDHRNLARLAAEIGDGADRVIQVPQLDGDVHDVAGLERVRAFLFASADERERLIAEIVA
jgi:anion-transporting  ArsA/GET3 family ATPase